MGVSSFWRPGPSGGGGRCRGRLALERALWQVDLLMQPRVLSLVVQGKAAPQAAAKSTTTAAVLIAATATT